MNGRHRRCGLKPPATPANRTIPPLMKTPPILACAVLWPPLLALSLSAAQATSAANAPHPPEEVSPARLGFSDASLRAIDALMTRYTAPDRFPGAVLLIARRDRIGYWKAFGVRDVDTRAPLERNDLFRIYSLTKPVTMAGLLLLHEQGRVGLDDPVAKYLPQFARVRVYDGSPEGRPPERPLTIRHLLTATSGLTYGVFGDTSAAGRIVLKARLPQVSQSLDDLMNRLAALPLVNDPGAAVSYGFQMDVVGKIIEVVSGRRLDAFLEERVFAPLGMKETAFTVPGTLVDRMPGLYNLKAGQPATKAPATAWTEAYGTPPRVLWGGHGLVSTPADYLRFARMIAGGGELNGKRILQRSSVAMMTSAQIPVSLPQVRERLGAGWTFGFATLVAMDPASTGARSPEGIYYHSGAANLYTWHDRDRDLIGLVWAQAQPYQVYPLFDDVRHAVANAVDEAAGQSRSAALP